MPASLQGKTIALIAADGVEKSEFSEPLAALRDAGARVDVISLKPGEIQAEEKGQPAGKFPVEKTFDQVDPGSYDALVIPGGVGNPDKLRVEPDVQAFVRAFFEAGKPVGAICHGPWVLIDAGVVSGRTLTSWPSIRTDLRNAGATVVDQEVVVDDGLVTSRKPADLPAFCAKLIEEFAEGRHAHQHAAE